ncbi:TRAP transporter permease [Fodinicurvata fenggangensis]|uniref:TRAP transporter permease n=1 Tax=Fodinicurvata fenggangensis TaxID=1121830 RepID=UPI000479B6FC|nr:TRAP transporter fused permease subunit [Fodinicurvata fenggangensis]
MKGPFQRLAGIFTDEDAGDPRITLLFGLAAIVFVLTHVVQVLTYTLPSGQFKIAHVGGAAALIFLFAAAHTKSAVSKIVHLLLTIVAAAAIFYIFTEHHALTSQRSFLPNSTDMLVAWVFLGICLYASLREWGWVVSAIAVVGLLYGYFGDLLPQGLLYHGGITLKRLIGYTSIPYFSGLLGSLAELSAGTIFPFMVLAAAMKMTGCIDFIMQVAFRIGGKTRAGPAQIAIISSGMMGMVSGSSVANAASTGALTIPLMKRVGFKPEFAGAVEAVSSTGGQITPPMMGLAAFLIVGLTGIPYGEIIIAAAFPALIYYLYLMFAVHLRAVKFDLDASADETMQKELEVEHSMWRTCLWNAHFFIAIAYLITMLLITNLPGRVSLHAAGILLGLYVLRELAFHWRGLANIIVNIIKLGARTAYDAALRGAQIGIVVAVIGVLVEVLTVTGFAQKLSFWMLELAGGDLALLLIVAALACIAFGLGLPTSASYILVALMGAPALVELGVPLLAAHFFVFFFANISAITPPVAICCLVTSKIADGSFFRTSFMAVRLGLPGFVLPFLFAVHPEILGIDANVLDALVVSAMALFGVIALNVMLEGFLFRRLHLLERLLLLPAAGGLLHPSLWASIAGLAIFAALTAWLWLASRRRQAAQEG